MPLHYVHTHDQPERILQGLRHNYIDGVKTARATTGIAGADKKVTD
jgi:hypothetical protein